MRGKAMNREDVRKKIVAGTALTVEESLLVGQMLYEAERNARDLRQVASYMGDILAASAQDAFMKKSTAKCERERQVKICESVISMLESEMLVGKRASDKKNVIDRCRKALTEAGQKA